MSLEDRLYPLLSAYHALPRGVQSGLGLAYRCLPEAWRWGSRYREFKHLTENTERWSCDELQEYQLKQLRTVLHHAVNYCPFYQKRFAKAGFHPEDVRALKDLERCPTIEKRDLIENIEAMASAWFRESRRLYLTTG